MIFKDTPTGYNFFAEFQAHEPEFDYLRSVEIDERINKIKWCKQSTSRDLFLLTTNGILTRTVAHHRYNNQALENFQ